MRLEACYLSVVLMRLEACYLFKGSVKLTLQQI
jgi:hypothetical protein